jgi:hypothetical protein
LSQETLKIPVSVTGRDEAGRRAEPMSRPGSPPPGYKHVTNSRNQRLKSITQKGGMIKMNLIAVCALLMLSLPGSGSASDQAGDSKTESEIRQMENRRFQAMLKVDGEELNRLLADDLTYTHSSGAVDTKSQLIDSLKSGERKYQVIETQDVKVRLYGSAAVITGRARLKTVSKGQESDFRVQFTDVYAKKKGHWQMVAWQSSRLPEK